MDNLDFAFKQAKGEFATVYHSNDIYHRDIIKKQMEVLQKNPDVKIVFTNAELFNDKKKFGKVFNDEIVNNRKYSYNEILKLLIENYNFFVCQSAFFRPKFYKKHIKKWNNNLFGYSADLDTWLRFSKKSKIIFLKKVLVKTSVGNSQMSVIEKNKLNKSDFFKVLNFHLKSSKIKLSNQDKNNLYLLNQRDLTRQIINLFILKKYERAYRLTKNLNFTNLFSNNKISKKLILIFVVKNLIISSFLIPKNLIRKIFIFLNQKFIT